MNFMTKEDLTEKLNNLGTMITDQATVLNLYPVFKAATSSSPQPTPGYVYDVLVEFTYKNKKNSVLLGDYLNRRLARHSVHGVLKTLKCVQNLVNRGSRNYRIYLRDHDDCIKNAPEFATQKNAFTGTALLEEIKKLVAEILVTLFNQDSINRDLSNESENCPVSSSLSGMGKNSNKQQDSKYDGFGNSPIDKTGVTDTIRSVVEQVLYTPDPRLERLEACLRGSRGKYQAAQVDLELGRVHETELKPRQEPRKHIPGRAGGGWEDEDSEDEFVEFGGLCLEPKDEDDKLGLITGTDEFFKIRRFCVDECLPVDLDILNSLIQELKNREKLNILFSLKHVLETESDDNILRALILTEKLVEHSLISANVLLTVLKPNLELRKIDENRKISVKSSKILATLEYLKDYKKL